MTATGNGLALSDELIARCGDRAAGYDRENRFFPEDCLYRDACCGGFHPANSILVHEIVGKTVLGIDLGEQPRWG